MSNKRSQPMRSTGLEEILMQCREAAEQAMRATTPRVLALREVLTEYRQAVEEIGAGSVKSESKSVQAAAKTFADKLEQVKGVLLRLTDEAGKDLDSSLEGLRKDEDFVTIALFGQTRAGKSTTLEALIGGDGATIGIGKQHTTTRIRDYFWPQVKRHSASWIRQASKDSRVTNSPLRHMLSSNGLTISSFLSQMIRFDLVNWKRLPTSGAWAKEPRFS